MSATETAAARHRAAVSLLQTSVAKRSSLTQMEHIARTHMAADAPNSAPEMIPRKRAALERVRQRTTNEHAYGHERAGTAYERLGEMDAAPVPSKYPANRGLPCEQEPSPPPLECWQPAQRKHAPAPTTASQPYHSAPKRSVCLSPPRHRCLSPPRRRAEWQAEEPEWGPRKGGQEERGQEERGPVCCQPRQLWPAALQSDEVGQGKMSEDIPKGVSPIPEDVSPIPEDVSPASSTNVQGHLPSLPGALSSLIHSFIRSFIRSASRPNQAIRQSVSHPICCAAGSPYWTEAMNPGDLPDGETSEYKNKEMQVCMHVCACRVLSVCVCMHVCACRVLSVYVCMCVHLECFP